MALKLSSSFVRRSLASHSWIGLMVGALMYLVCLSGTLAVLYPEFERWEQAAAPEFLDYDAALVDEAYAAALASGLDITHHMYVGLPNPSLPRLTVASEEEGWVMHPDATPAERLDHEWTHLLLNLHLYLHLPSGFGMILVSALGAMLLSLIVSGFLAHPRILKDAFSFRLGGSRRLEQVDIHNRLSVWGAPFHVMIAVTGAFFGLASPIAALLSQAFYDGDTDALMAEVYGAEPILEQQAAQPALGRALAQTRAHAPDATPLNITVEYADDPARQFIVVGAQHPDRLSYWEEYRFDASGEFIDTGGFVDGPAARQVVYSVYRLHFGHFGGVSVQLAFIVLGLALTVVSVTGINIWLARRRTRDCLNNLWTGIVWTTPAALALTAIIDLVAGASSALYFWVSLGAGLTLAQWLDDEARSRIVLQFASGGALLLVVLLHAARFGTAAFSGASAGINAGVVAAGALLFWLAWRQRDAAAAESADPSGSDPSAEALSRSQP